ncbi:MAG: hypothetical protein CVU57_16260 [Deltaproteobacteria bacterium HGW-Deltaproteobacteria-15]|jgi:hypothetical protein|nr:MAG: hypothetical protein CVU57_16260 [Deltaproteobacteria bacterium HGW-Deltaproteobacteria-15]
MIILKANIPSHDENISRFIFSKSHYVKTTGRVKYAAFLPLEGKTSVFRTSCLTESEIWTIGKQVGIESGRGLKARGDLSVKEVTEESLLVVSETSQHPLHADIVNWPMEEARNILLAKKLADKAKGVCL